VLGDQEKELRQAKKRERESAIHIHARKAEDALLRERVERQRNQRSLGVIQRQATRRIQDEQHRKDKSLRDEAGRQAIQRHKVLIFKYDSFDLQ
jgi:hypothetical protein